MKPFEASFREFSLEVSRYVGSSRRLSLTVHARDRAHAIELAGQAGWNVCNIKPVDRFIQFLPPPDFLPYHTQHEPDETCVMCENRLARKVPPVMVRVMSIDGVAQPLGTYLSMKKDTLDKIKQALKGDDKHEQ